MKILVTGGAGFIGSHLSLQLIKLGFDVIGLDCLNEYYDVQLKYDRLSLLGIIQKEITWHTTFRGTLYPNYRFVKMRLEDKDRLLKFFKEECFDIVINLAAQAGIRYSITNPDAYIQSNIVGFLNLLEACRYYPVKHFIYASSSSVYGLNGKVPFSVHDNTSHPISLYAATKKSNELMAHTYSHLYAIPTTGLRFFTVYGPYGRPDMSPSLFAHAIYKGEPLKIFNYGQMQRDFTYIDDIVGRVVKVMRRIPQPNSNWDNLSMDPSFSSAPYILYNIGSQHPVTLIDYIHAFEKAIGKEALKEYLPMQDGDVQNTFSDMSEMERDFGYIPQTSIEEGVGKFVQWFKLYYHY